jgi:hypothetical protein
MLTERPRPVTRGADTETLAIAASIGWREFVDGKWTASNAQNAYLPFTGILSRLASAPQDSGYVYFYYAATVRVEEEADERLLTSLRWFFERMPDVKRRWREGVLVAPGTPERE